MIDSKKTLIVTFYSYKGGTGRTTTTANVAALLAAKDKKVVCIDMDMEGPGLSLVFNIPENIIKRSVQSFFVEDNSFSAEYLLDLKKILEIPTNWNNLYIVPGSPNFNGVIDYSDGNRMIDRMNKLKESIIQDYSPDFILIDSPNGYGDLAALSMYACNYLIVLFRWSRQHLLGTIRVSEFTKRYGIPFILVASCVPLDPQKRKINYYKLLKSIEFNDEPIEIEDDDELKWVEKVIFFEDKPEKYQAYQGYNNIADALIQKIEK